MQFECNQLDDNIVESTVFTFLGFPMRHTKKYAVAMCLYSPHVMPLSKVQISLDFKNW